MSRIWEIARREYLENVRTKAFLMGLILTPVWMGLIFFIPKLITDSEVEVKPVVIVDRTGILGKPLAERLRADQGFVVQVEEGATAWQRLEGGISRVDELRISAGAGELYAVLLTVPLLEKRPPEAGEFASEVLGASRSSDDAFRGPTLAARVNDVVNAEIARRRDLDHDLVELLERRAIPYIPVDEQGKASTPAFAFLPFVFMMLLFMGIVGISQMLVSSTLEEKANRVYEVLLSSVSPMQLMTGKILGICAVGFTLLFLWSGGGLLAAKLQGFTALVSGEQLALFVAYYVLGFLMIASLMVAIGSACNTLKEAQNLMAPLSVLLALPVMLSMVIMRNPNGDLATAASFFPPFTPFLMMARVASVPPPPQWQVTLSLVLLVGATYVAIRMAARVFRTGVLLYGQPPSLKEIFRWLRTKD